MYSGLGSDHIHVGAGNNIIDAEAIWVGQVHHHTAGSLDDRNIIDYSALNRSLVVKASVNEPVTGRRSFTVDKIDPDGAEATTTDFLQGVQEIRFAPNPNTVMLEGAFGRTTAMSFLSDVGPNGTIHTLDFSNVIGNSFTGAGVTVQGGDSFAVRNLQFEGFTRLIGSDYKYNIDLSGATKNLIIDSGTGGADIKTGSGNDIIRFEGEGEVDAGEGFDILDRSHLEGDTIFSFSRTPDGDVASINEEATVRNVELFKASQGNNTFSVVHSYGGNSSPLVLPCLSA